MEGQILVGGGISPYSPPGSTTAYTMKIIYKRRPKGGEYTITIVFGSFYLCLLYFNDYTSKQRHFKKIDCEDDYMAWLKAVIQSTNINLINDLIKSNNNSPVSRGIKFFQYIFRVYSNTLVDMH